MHWNVEYLKREDCNFISVDWGKLAKGINYVRAVSSSVIVGEFTGDLINFLVEQGSVLKNFHVIGFSLGAHVAGKAGATVNGLLPRVTGNYYIINLHLKNWGQTWCESSLIWMLRELRWVWSDTTVFDDDWQVLIQPIPYFRWKTRTSDWTRAMPSL